MKKSKLIVCRFQTSENILVLQFWRWYWLKWIFNDLIYYCSKLILRKYFWIYEEMSLCWRSKAGLLSSPPLSRLNCMHQQERRKRDNWSAGLKRCIIIYHRLFQQRWKWKCFRGLLTLAKNRTLKSFTNVNKPVYYYYDATAFLIKASRDNRTAGGRAHCYVEPNVRKSKFDK